MTALTVLHSDFSELGGAEYLLAEQARWFVAQGHQVRVVALRALGDRWRPVLAGLDVQVLEGVPKVERLGVAALDALVPRVREALAGSEVVLAFNYPSAPLAARAVAAGVRTVWYCCEPYRSLHPEETFPAAAARYAAGRTTDGPTRQYARRARRRALARWVAPWSTARRRALAAWDAAGVARLDAVVAISAFSAGMVDAAFGRSAEVVPAAVTFPAPRPPRPIHDRTRPQLLVLTRLVVPKQVDLLLRAAAIARRRLPGLHVHVVGDGPQRERLERQAARELPGAATFHGPISRAALDALAARCDLFALLPADEPFGMVFPEAAAWMLRVLGPDHGGPRSILDGVGLACDAFDAAAVATGLVALATEPDAARLAALEAADRAVRARYAPATVMPALGRAVFGA